MILISFLQAFSRELPEVCYNILASLVKHHADVFAKVSIILEDLVKPQQRVYFELFLQHIPLQWFDIRLTVVGVVAYHDFATGTGILTLVHPETWNPANIDHTHVQVAKTKITTNQLTGNILIRRFLFPL